MNSKVHVAASVTTADGTAVTGFDGSSPNLVLLTAGTHPVTHEVIMTVKASNQAPEFTAEAAADTAYLCQY